MIRYLNRAEVGKRLGVTAEAVKMWQRRHPDFPKPDAMIGAHPGWSAGTIEKIQAWRARLPGRGAPGRPRPRQTSSE